ncbi:MAG TPA: hypothetical protein IAA62_01325 [Candidatus Caccopulliclostridium gallistercoris]|uniref:Uncharacterized protein n=1 Tax=Candidatus Caccopulliclostridium gallistercoris TaxID=2840719 RepID=A0A9D1SYY0_9FIRM|nr:hypothetical protein [Candidatus Caccopulliclostridium gallistercoris]
MYTYKFTDEQSEKIKKQTDLFDQFKNIDKKYSFDNSSIALDRMEYTAPSQEEVEESAKSSLQSYLDQGKNDILEEYSSKVSNIENLQNTNKENLTSQKENLKNTYKELKQNASEDATSRGLARSSIVVNILDAFDQGMLDEYSKLDQEYTKKFQELEEEKSLLESQKNSALNSFDISYATKLNEKIEEINKEIEEKEKEVLEYNNKIAEKEAEYKLDQQKQNQELIDFIGKYGSTALNRVKEEEKYNAALSYFYTLDKNEALAELLNNDQYKVELGNYYSQLERTLRNR